MSWTYDYYADGRVNHAYDSTWNFWDRSYSYDHVGRLQEAGTNRVARGQSWDLWHPDPYKQTLNYDVWNNLKRTGYLYANALSDVATYSNNRRAEWSYNANGQATNNSSYQNTYDVAGQNLHAVSQQQVGDGTTEWPRQPGVEITQTYDAVGRPCKRTQITRQEDRDLETGQFYGVIEDTLTSHYIHSSVLGARVAELTPSGQTNIWVYAGGQRIATTLAETAGNTTFEHHNPMTGSWVTTNGHSADRAAARQERDPLNGQLPLANPGSSTYAAQNPNQPLFILGGDPNDYSGGHEIDGLPVSNSEFARRVGNGSAVGAVLINGRPVAQIDLSRYAFMSSFSLRLDFWKTLTSENSNDSFLTPDEEHPGSSVDTLSTSHAQEWLGALIINFNLGISSRFAAAPQNPKSELRDFLSKHPDCAKHLDAKGSNLTDLFTFVDTRGNEALLNTTMDKLGVEGSTLTLREGLAGGGARTVIGRATAYLDPSVYGSSLVFGDSPEARGELFFHEIFVHYASGSFGHIEVARSLGLEVKMPAPPTLGRSADWKERLNQRVKYELAKDAAASNAIQDWISRGCK